MRLPAKLPFSGLPPELPVHGFFWSCPVPKPSLPAAKTRQLLSDLPPTELLRARQISDPVRQIAFCQFRRIMFQTLARLLDLSPSVLAFHYLPTGKPQLAHLLAPNSPIGQFSLSHIQTDSRLFLAFAWSPSPSLALGIDIEPVTARKNLPRIARKSFSQANLADISRAEFSPETFFRHWTALEATVKANNSTLSRHLGENNLHHAPSPLPHSTPAPHPPQPATANCPTLAADGFLLSQALLTFPLHAKVTPPTRLFLSLAAKPLPPDSTHASRPS